MAEQHGAAQQREHPRRGPERWEKTLRAVEAAAAVAIALITFFYTRYAHQQAAAAIKSASAAAAANRNTAAAIDQDARQFAGTLLQMKAQTAAQNRAAQYARRAYAAALAAARPWMGATALTVQGFSAGKAPKFVVIWQNAGNRPAEVTSTSVCLGAGPRGCAERARWQASTSVVVPGEKIESATQLLHPLTEAEIVGLRPPGAPSLYVYAVINYTGIGGAGGRFRTSACWYYVGASFPVDHGFGFCPSYNSAR